VDSVFQGLPFKDAIAYLQQKIALGTDSWRAIADDENDAIFVVAGAKADLLSELRAAVISAIKSGNSLAEFRARFEQIARRWAWTPASGKNLAWRSRLVFRTNLRTAYAAGRYQYQLDPEVQRIQPYLKFIHSSAPEPRPHHRALDGKVFLSDTLPFFPPSGYGCGCRTITLSQREFNRQGLELSSLRRGNEVVIDGQKYRLEPDQGWDYTPGQSSDDRRREIIRQVADRQPPDIRARFLEEVKRISDR